MIKDLLHKTFIVIPAKDESTRIGGVLSKLLNLGFENIVVVDDGSMDDTNKVASEFGVNVLEHVINLGAGAATQTGIDYSVRRGADYIVTMDADHQHQPEDVMNLVKMLVEEKVDIVIGSRFIDKENDIPTSRIFYNKIANWITYFLTGVKVTDSQSGMKAFTKKFAKQSRLNFNGFEFSVEMIRYIKLNKSDFLEYPIKVIYTEDTMSKGQSFFTGVKMLGKLMRMNRW